jgi:hypothetical protein
MGPDPTDGILGETGEHGQPGQRRSGPPVAAETTDLHRLAPPGSLLHVVESVAQVGEVIGHPEIRPRDVGVGPRGIPQRIEMQTEVRRFPALMGCSTGPNSSSRRPGTPAVLRRVKDHSGGLEVAATCSCHHDRHRHGRWPFTSG